MNKVDYIFHKNNLFSRSLKLKSPQVVKDSIKQMFMKYVI